VLEYDRSLSVKEGEFGSGTVTKLAVKKYNMEDFRYRLIFEFILKIICELYSILNTLYKDCCYQVFGRFEDFF
jgi:hypothetical protein